MSTFVDFDNPQKDVPLSFTVTVTGCKNCPYARHKQVHCNIPMTSIGAEKVYAENKDQLTNSCPLLKEGEKK